MRSIQTQASLTVKFSWTSRWRFQMIAVSKNYIIGEKPLNFYINWSKTWTWSSTAWCKTLIMKRWERSKKWMDCMLKSYRKRIRKLVFCQQFTFTTFGTLKNALTLKQWQNRKALDAIFKFLIALQNLSKRCMMLVRWLRCGLMHQFQKFMKKTMISTRKYMILVSTC